MFYVRQGEPLGLGHAVLQAAGHVGDNPFAVLLGDDLVDVANPVLPRMAEVRAEYGGSVLLLMEVSDEQISAYGCAAVEPTEVADVVRVTYLLPDASDFPRCWPVLKRWFGDVRPAATMMSVPLMKPEMRIEIEVTALKQR